MDYYSVSKSKEILSHAATRMDLDDFVLSEINQSGMNTALSHLHQVSKIVKFLETERMVATRS